MSEESWQHREAAVNGVRLHYVEQGQGPLVVLLHGFPEFWYSWRHQIPALAEAGFRVIASDQRGYNTSEMPRGVRSSLLPQPGPRLQLRLPRARLYARPARLRGRAAAGRRCGRGLSDGLPARPRCRGGPSGAGSSGAIIRASVARLCRAGSFEGRGAPALAPEIDLELARPPRHPNPARIGIHRPRWLNSAVPALGQAPRSPSCGR
jgi:hypothetical protein